MNSVLSNFYVDIKIVLAGIVLAFSLTGLTEARQDNIQIQLAAYFTDNGIVTASTPLLRRSFFVDPSSEAHVIISSPSTTLRVTLIDPEGNRFEVGEPEQSGVKSFKQPDPSTPHLTGLNYFFRLSNPAAGAWHYEVEETQVISEPVHVLFVYFPGNGIRAAMLGGGEQYPLDQGISLGILVTDGPALLLNYSVNALLFKPGDATFPTQQIAFADDGLGRDATAGDGLFTTEVNPGIPGLFQVHAELNGTSLSTGLLFRRTVSTTFHVVQQHASLDGTFQDRGEDDDGNGLLDRVVISPDIFVLDAGNYNTSIILTASNSASVSANTVQDFTIGNNAPNVSFPSKDIKNLGISGPYQVSQVHVELLNVEGARTTDIRYDLGQTADYDLSELELEPIELTNVFQDFGVDTDGNGEFDLLQVSIELDIFSEGFYQWNARLVDSHNTEIDLAHNSRFLHAGINTIDFSFDGRNIGDNGVHGPYIVTGFLISGAGELLITSDVATTQAFNVTDFEGFNSPPLAQCQDVTVRIAPEACTADASVDNGSFDPDGDPIILDQSPAGPYGLGDTLVTLTVTDDSSASDACRTTATVVDDTPPIVEAALVPVDKVKTKKKKGKAKGKKKSKAKGKKTREFMVTFGVDDNCDPAPQVIGSVQTPALDGLAIELKITSKVKITFDAKKGTVKIEGPDPEVLLKALQEFGGIVAENGQRVRFKERHARTMKVEFKVKNDGTLEVKAPRLSLGVTGEDAAGNTTTVLVSP